MSETTTIDPQASITLGRKTTRDLHVKGIPEAIWRRARCNAALSGIPFRDFVTRLLAESCPVPDSGGSLASQEAITTPHESVSGIKS